jgi:TolA-binding protein
MAAQATSSVAMPEPSPRERYDRALTLEAAHPGEALSIYRELARGSDSWAMNALYAEARLELERGNKDNARKRFADYLARYPTGPNANDARELSAKLQ